MDQQFESDVMQDLAGEAPPMSADEAFESEAYEEGFEEEGMDEDAMLEEMDAYEEGEQEFEGEEDSKRASRKVSRKRKWATSSPRKKSTR